MCAPDNGHHAFTVNLAPYDSTKIGQVTVQLQTLAANGNWTHGRLTDRLDRE